MKTLTKLPEFSSEPKLLFKDEKRLILSDFKFTVLLEDLPRNIFGESYESLLKSLIMVNSKVEYRVQSLNFDLGLSNENFDDAALAFFCSENGISSMITLDGDSYSDLFIDVYNVKKNKIAFLHDTKFSKKSLTALKNRNILDDDYKINGINFDLLIQVVQKSILMSISGKFGLPEFSF